MNQRYKCTIAYAGHGYFGWQNTKSGPSIQGSIEKALYQIFHQEIVVEAASRTDRGVHAKGQVIHFSLPPYPLSKLQKQLNGVLPAEIRILKVEEVPASFHATLSAQKKEYHYFLCLREVQWPIHRLYSWHFPRILDLNIMEQAAKELLGIHDFSTFANEQDPNPFVCCSQMTLIPLENGERLQIKLQANRFLYKMARNLVGTLAYIGCGKLPPDAIYPLLAAKDRRQAGMTAPAHGLYLSEVFYD